MNFSPSWSVLETSIAVSRTATVELDELLRGLCCCELEMAFPSKLETDVADEAIFDETLWFLMIPNSFVGGVISFFSLLFNFIQVLFCFLYFRSRKGFSGVSYQF